MKHIVMFGGGSGGRGINIAFCREGYAVTRVVPAWDSGGSSRALRDALDVLAIGDIRQALMTMAHGEGRVGSVVRFFNARLSEAAPRHALLAEFEFYVGGAHPLLATMEPGIRGAILNYLRVFRGRIGEDFDFRRGSIGNFVLTGAYFAHGKDINTAIFVFRKLCAIEGNVWPSTLEDRCELHATLRDGRRLQGQDRITALAAEDAEVGIRDVGLDAAGRAAITANPAVLEAVATADVLLFGPGSFYTSLLPHLAVGGIVDAIVAARAPVPRIFIGNILECAETRGRTLAELVEAFDAAAGRRLLSHVIANRQPVPIERVVNGFRYLPEGPAPSGTGAAPQWVAGDFEDPWSRGRHDAALLLETVARIAGA